MIDDMKIQTWVQKLTQSCEGKTIEGENALLTPPNDILDFQAESPTVRREVLEQLLAKSTTSTIPVLTYLSQWDGEPDIRMQCIEQLCSLYRNGDVSASQLTSVLENSGSFDAVRQVREFAVIKLEEKAAAPYRTKTGVSASVPENMATRGAAVRTRGAISRGADSERTLPEQESARRESRMILDRIAQSAPDRRLRSLAGRWRKE